jgi:hypothetical protein
MSASLVPSPLDYVGRRRFSFYPPIKNAEPNEWLLGASSWSEVQVVNSQTGSELWIPRRYVGAVSDTSGPLLIVGLTKELEYSAGDLKPRFRGLIEMPLATENGPGPQVSRRTAGPAPIVGIRLEDGEDSHINRALAILTVTALVVCLLAALISTLARS